MLTSEEESELESIINLCMDYSNKLNDWENRFIEDIHERFEQYGNNLILTERQWTALRKTYDKAQQEMNK